MPRQSRESLAPRNRCRIGVSIWRVLSGNSGSADRNHQPGVSRIEHVFVNGRPVWSEGKPTGERSGRALRRQQMQAEAR